MMEIMDADYVVREDALHRNRRARAYSRRVARRRALKALVLGMDIAVLVAGVMLVWLVWAHI